MRSVFFCWFVNDFLWPVIVYTDVQKMPVTAGLLLLQDVYGNYRMIGQLMGTASTCHYPDYVTYFLCTKVFCSIP